MILVFKNNDVKYCITNCITTFQKEKKKNWKPIWKRKRYRRRLLSAGSGSAGSGSAGSGSAKGGSGSAKTFSASASLRVRIEKGSNREIAN
jgi:hypothetical protein